MNIRRSKLGLLMWILSPILLVLGLLVSPILGVGAALGPMDALTMHIPAALFFCAGLGALVGHILSPPHAHGARLLLYIYTIPTILLGGYSLYAIAHSGYLAATSDEYLHVTIAGRHTLTTEERGVLSVLKGCATDWQGHLTTSASDACALRFYIYIHPPPEDGWDYAGGGALQYIWKQLDEHGYITKESDEMVLTFHYNRRGPILAVDGNDLLLQNRDLLVVNFDMDWKPHVARGREALDNLDLPDVTRQKIISCVSYGSCR